MKKKLQKLALIELIISACSFIINYFFYHFVTDTGFGAWQAEPGKPFVSNLIGIFATMFLFGAVTAFIASFIFDDKK